MTVDRRVARAVPVTVVLLVIVVGLLLIADDHWRRGAAALSGAAAVAALLRVAVPERFIGVLAVRSKPFDVLFLLALSALLAAMAIGL